jgi:hypothetical protein
VSVRWLAAAVAALTAGVVAILLALDVGRWESAFARGDVRFTNAPTRQDLWEPNEILPFQPAKRLLGVDDDIVYRHTLRSFYNARPHANRWRQTNIDQLRSEATVTLAEYIRNPKNGPERRSQAANLLGVMALGLAATDDPQQRLRFLQYASRSFRGALTMDSENEDAKFNLELALRLLRQSPTSTGGGSARGPGRGGGAALAEPGSGY